MVVCNPTLPRIVALGVGIVTFLSLAYLSSGTVSFIAWGS